MIPTRTTTEPCVAHRYHRPVPLYQEEHHVIPRAWQHFFTPVTVGEGFVGAAVEDADAGDQVEVALGLWDTRTVALCRTGHGNVHFLLVRAMRAYTSVLGDLGSNPLRFIDEAVALVKRGARKDGLRVSPEDLSIARLGMVRFQEAGGSLLDLCHAGLLGEI